MAERSEVKPALIMRATHSHCRHFKKSSLLASARSQIEGGGKFAAPLLHQRPGAREKRCRCRTGACAFSARAAWQVGGSRHHCQSLRNRARAKPAILQRKNAADAPGKAHGHCQYFKNQCLTQGRNHISRGHNGIGHETEVYHRCFVTIAQFRVLSRCRRVRHHRHFKALLQQLAQVSFGAKISRHPRQYHLALVLSELRARAG